MKMKTKVFVHSCMFWNKPVTNEPIILCYVILRAWFVCHRHYLERTKTFVLGFVFIFVLTHGQAIVFLKLPNLSVNPASILSGVRLPWWEASRHLSKEVVFFIDGVGFKPRIKRIKKGSFIHDTSPTYGRPQTSLNTSQICSCFPEDWQNFTVMW